MKRDTAIEKTEKNEISGVKEDFSIARRGLDDLEKAQSIAQLQMEMFALFKANEYSACAKVCKKILKLDDSITIVQLLLMTSEERVAKTKPRKKTRR